jgi:hypothetical protein
MKLTTTTNVSIDGVMQTSYRTNAGVACVSRQALAAHVEEWSLPDATRFIELSFKVAPHEARDAERAFHALLDRLQIGHDGDPDPKTPRVLRFFAERLR